MTPGVFKAFLCHAEFKKITANWTFLQKNELAFLQKWKSERFTFIATITTRNTSCI